MRGEAIWDQQTLAQVAKQVQAWRTYRGVSQRRLGRLIGVAQGTISHLENGRRQMTVSQLYRIAKALDVSPGRMIDDTPNPQED